MHFDREFFKNKSAVLDTFEVLKPFGKLPVGTKFQIVSWGCNNQKQWYWVCQIGTKKKKIFKETLKNAIINKTIVEL